MFLLINFLGWSINEMGLADEFVACVIALDKFLCAFFPFLVN